MMLLEFLSWTLLGILFYPKPNFVFTEEEINEYENIFENAHDGFIDYKCSYPKYRFIEYISVKRGLVMHGSNNHNITNFETREQTLYNGKYINAVFTSKDAIWPAFFAVLDKTKVKGSIRNACLETKRGKKFYFFSLTRDTMEQIPWTTGMLYFLQEDSFCNVSKGTVRFDEWISETPVNPIARLVISPSDFYFSRRFQYIRKRRV